MGSKRDGLSREQLIEYLTLYQKAAQEHTRAVEHLAQCQKRVELARQGLPLLPRTRGRPPKRANRRTRPSTPSLPQLEAELQAAQRQAETAWSLYKRLDDMSTLPRLSPRQCGELIQWLENT